MRSPNAKWMANWLDHQGSAALVYYSRGLRAHHHHCGWLLKWFKGREHHRPAVKSSHSTVCTASGHSSTSTAGQGPPGAPCPAARHTKAIAANRRTYGCSEATVQSVYCEPCVQDPARDDCITMMRSRDDFFQVQIRSKSSCVVLWAHGGRQTEHLPPTIRSLRGPKDVSDLTLKS